MYVAAVEVATRHQVGVEEAMMKTLVDYSPSLSTSARGWVEVRMTFHATGLAHACTKAAAIARAATGAEALACQVMTGREYEERNAPQRGTPNGGRHAAYKAEPKSELKSEPESAWVLPRQSTEPWQRPQRQRGRHSA
jgi:hypothetical protein